MNEPGYDPIEQDTTDDAFEARLDAYEARTAAEAAAGTPSWQWSDHGRYETDDAEQAKEHEDEHADDLDDVLTQDDYDLAARDEDEAGLEL